MTGMGSTSRAMVALLSAALLLPTACGDGPDAVLIEFLTTAATNPPDARRYLAAADAAFPGADDSFEPLDEPSRLFGQRSVFKAKSTTVTGDKARVEVEVLRPDDDDFKAPRSGPTFDEAAWTAARIAWLQRKDLPMKSTSDSFLLLRENGTWKVFLDLKKRKDDADQKKLARLKEEAGTRGWNLTGASLDDFQGPFCANLERELPFEESDRKFSASVNTALYGCPPPGPFVPPLTGMWRIRTSKNAIDDTETVVMSLSSTEGVLAGPTLVIRCDGGKLDVYVLVGKYVADSHNLLVRRDAQPATKWWGSRSVSGDSLFVAKPAAFLTSLRNVESLVIQYQPYSERPSELIFPVKGIEETWKSLPPACAFK